jgi:hypothetical protein
MKELDTACRSHFVNRCDVLLIAHNHSNPTIKIDKDGPNTTDAILK